MKFISYTYTPAPASPDVRLTCVITRQDDNGQDEVIETQYQIHKQHRDRTPDKSQWIISCEDEVSVFAKTIGEGEIVDGQYMWGLFIPIVKPEVLGITDKKLPSKIAKFDNGIHNGFWHGYPAEYLKKNQDIPPYNVLFQWHKAGIITTATMKKIKGGQPCNL